VRHTQIRLPLSSFDNLGVPPRLSTLLAQQGIQTPTPIQTATLPDSLAGRDVLGRGRTGSGKTYAFLLPLVARLTDGQRPRRGAPRALILAPTRELVAQIDTALAPLARAAGLTTRTVFGGVGQQPQVNALRRGVDVVVACPGRLEDLMGQGHCSLDDVEITVLDEADHMADLGFLPAVRRILRRTPRGTQRLLFSATLDKAVDSLVREFLTDPVTHEADSPRSPVATMSHHVLQVAREHRLSVLVDLTSAPGRTLVFTRTKHGAKALTRQLNRSGVPAVELHGNLGQGARTRNLDAFHSGRASTLVATDVAARGIHVDDITRVVHADLPAEHKSYLHRSGRTARAGNTGTVVTLINREQAREAKLLAKAAGITPMTTNVDGVHHPVLRQLAPGDRELSGGIEIAAPASARNGGGRADGRSGGRNRRRSGRGRSTSGGERPSRTPKASGQKASTGSSGRPRRSSGRTPSGSGTHSAAAFSAVRR
jgi:superfamily II DNA/RNA helicase